MSTGPLAIDVDEVVKVLLSLGIDEATAREQLNLAQSDEERVEEIAALTVESEAGLLLPLDIELSDALFDLVDGLRQAGVALSLTRTAGEQAVVVGSKPGTAFEARFWPNADAEALLVGMATILPQTHQILRAPSYEAGDAMPLVLLDRGSYAWLSAAVGGEKLEAVLQPVVGSLSAVTFDEVPSDRLHAPDLAQRFQARLREIPSSSNVDELWRRISRYDARVAWPDGNKRPPGDDLFELSIALGGEPLARALTSADPSGLADVLYRFALVTCVGAHWDMLAARQNPGMSAQGTLGFGQLAWSWFIFEAFGARAEAARVASLLDHDWIRTQERGTVTARQRAWFDLGVFMRDGKRGPALGRVRELLPLIERAAWQNPACVAAALATHSETRGDQLTHLPICYTWPAPMYALAARAGAEDLLPAHDPFLSRPLHLDAVNEGHEIIVWCHQQLERFDAMDETRLPPLLDPLPVIVDVRITEVDATQAHGRTLLAVRDDAEHHVVAPHGGRAMRAGEVWLFEVSGSRQSRARARYDDLGEVSYNIALPSGEWLRKVDTV